MRKICFITGTRAEYGLMSRLMRMVKDSPDCQLQVIATNMHLMPEHGETSKEIEADGFTIDCKVPMPKPSDDSYGIVSSMAIEMDGINQALQKLAPDMVVMLGDRYEMLVAAAVAMMHRIPLAHIHGGEVSEGAIDDSIRHAITKMSSLHFTSTEEYRNRVIQLGEQPDRVFHVGALGVENLKAVPLLGKAELEKTIGFPIDENTVLATYHPATLGNRTAQEEISDFLAALDEFPNLRVIFTMPNSDQGGDIIRMAIEEYCGRHADRCRAFASLGLRRYLSALQFVAAAVGNSSSGIIEVPSAGIPTLNVGDRQKGRARGASVCDVASDKASIVAGFKKVLSPEFKAAAKSARNPYDKADTAASIFHVISTYPLEKLIQKQFYNIV